MTIESEKDIKILVTGGSGLLGHGIQFTLDNCKDERFTRRSNEMWYFVNSKDADLRNQEETLALFERIKPDFVIHLAGMNAIFNINSNGRRTL